MNIDFSTFKDFRITEGHALQFRMEMFNAPNHVALGTPNTGWGTQNQTPGGELRAHPVHQPITSDPVCAEVSLLTMQSLGFHIPLFLLGVAGAVAQTPAPATFTGSVAPILQAHCQVCHRPGEAAPFSLLTYEQARPWAKAIKEAVLQRKMPPWFADPHYGKFSNDRSLPQSEIDTLVAWVDAGAPQGNPKDMPAPREFADGWAIPKPDAVIELPTPYRDPGHRHDRVSAHPDPGAVQDRPVGAVRGSAADRPRARAPHHRVHPRAGIEVAQGRQAGDSVRARKSRRGRRTRTPANCRAIFWSATRPASRRSGSSRGRRS